MAVAAGKDGKVTIFTSSGSGEQEIAEMGTWSISGPSLNLVEHSAFGDERGRQKIGMMTPQNITFDGYADLSTGNDTTLDVFPQRRLITFLSSGTPIYASSKPAAASGPRKLRLWANDDATLTGYGFWSLDPSSTTLATKIYITGVEAGQSMDGVSTISFTAAVTGANMVWSSST
jgi:hypothetical protein